MKLFLSLRRSLSTLPQLNKQMSLLGTETAYAVALEAAELSKQGKTIYPFHIGDLNFKTPKIVKDGLINALVVENKTGYPPAAGIPDLKASIATHINKTRKPASTPYTSENITVVPGGKPVIGKFLTTCMNKGDHVLYPTPGYPIYESLIRFLGGEPRPYKYIEDKQTGKIKIDMDHLLKHSLTPKTTCLIYNNFQNPTGAVSDDTEFAEMCSIAKKNNLWVLADEAYWDVIYGEGGAARSVVSVPGMQDRTVILFTFSKSWAMTGWRLGAGVGPAHIINQFSKLTTNNEACTTHFVQAAGIKCLETPEAVDFTKDMVKTLKERRDLLVEAVNRVPGFRCVSPGSTFYLWVNVTEAAKKVGCKDSESFRKYVLNKTGVSACARTHFGDALPDEKDCFLRFAFSGIDVDKISAGLEVLRKHFS